MSHRAERIFPSSMITVNIWTTNHSLQIPQFEVNCQNTPVDKQLCKKICKKICKKNRCVDLENQENLRCQCLLILLLQTEEWTLLMEDLRINFTSGATGEHQKQNERQTKSINPHWPTFTTFAPQTPSWVVSRSQGKDAQQPQYPWEIPDSFCKRERLNLWPHLFKAHL